jgi:hypothetical protein
VPGRDGQSWYARALADVRWRLMARRRAAYRALLGPGEHGLTRDQLIVWQDLRRFCYADQPTFDADPRVHAFKEGRREVLLRIEHFIGLSDRDLEQLRSQDDDDGRD